MNYPLYRIIAPLLAATLFASCGLSISEPQPEPDEIRVQTVDPRCLESAADVLGRYFEGRLSSQELSNFCDCTAKSFDVFGKNTKGERDGEFSPRELKKFLEKYLVPGKEISDTLMAEVMEIKSAILGGTPDVLTRGELDRAQDLIAFMKIQLTKILPHLPLTRSRVEEMSEESLKTSISVLEEVGLALGERLEKSGSRYRFRNLDRFLNELSKLPGGGWLTWVNAVKERIPFVQGLKGILIGEPVDGIYDWEWKRFLGDGARWVGIWFRYHKWQARSSGLEIQHILDEAKDLLSRSLDHHPGRLIPMEEVDRLIDCFKSDELPLPPQAIKAGLRPFFLWVTGVYAGLYPGKNIEPEGLNAEALDRGIQLAKAYFAGKIRETDPLLSEVMELKVSIFGGSRDWISASEVSRVLEVIRILVTEIGDLETFDRLTPQRVSTLKDEELTTSVSAIAGAGDRVAELLERTTESYSVERFGLLLNELERVFGAHDWIGLIRRNFPLIKAVKSILIAPSGDVISGEEWKPLIRDVSRWYTLWLRIAHLHDSQIPWHTDPGRTRLSTIVEDTRRVLGGAVMRHPQGGISLLEMDALVDAMPESALPISDRGVLKRTLRPVFCNLLSGARDVGAAACEEKGFSLALLDRMGTLIERWREGQRFLEELYKHFPGSPEVTRPQLIEIARSRAFLDGLRLSPIGKSEAADLLSTIQKSPRLFYGDERVILFPTTSHPRHQSRHFQSYYNLTQLHWIRILGRLLIESYGRPGDGYLVEKQFVSFLEEGWELACALKWMAPENLKDGSFGRRFRDANLFTFSADARNSLLNLDEISEYFALILSAYSSTQGVYSWMSTRCELSEEVDFFGYKKVEPRCFNEQFTGLLMGPGSLELLPGVQKYFRGLNGREAQGNFYSGLEQTARRPDFKPGDRVGVDEIQGFVMGLIYMEVLNARFDRNSNGLWERYAKQSNVSDELAPAFEVFYESLDQYARLAKKDLSRDDLYQVFLYLLAHGKTPDGVIDWIGWKLGDKEVRADRGRLIQILAFLSNQ